MTVVDTAMLGHYRDTALAGAGIGGGVLLAVSVLGTGAIMGLDTLVPQALGAREEGRARHLIAVGLRLALLVAAPLCLLAAAAAAVLPLSPVEPAVAREASIYLFGRLPGLVPILLFTAMRSYLQAHHVTRPMVWAVVIGNLVNLVANWILIFGDGGLEALGLPGIGLPALGVLGAAMTSSLVAGASALVLWLSLRQLHRDPPPASRSEPASTSAPVTAIVRLGLPVGLQLLAEVGIFALTGLFAGVLGRVPAAAHQVALALASFSFSMALGIGAATSVQVGRAIGATDSALARRAGLLGIAAGCAMMSASGLLFLLFPHPLARLFTSDPEVASAAVPLLRIAAVFQLSDAIQAVSSGALRGAGDTRFSFLANLVGHYGVGLPAALALCFAAGLGAAGLWWALSLGLTAVALLQLIRFARLTSRPVARAGAG
jgi:MATE family multidrug resistance protein